MLLHTLIGLAYPHRGVDGLPNLNITGVKEDSRLIRPGDLFIARAGTMADGAQFLADAAGRGAAAAVVAARSPDSALPQIVVKDTAPAASVLANLFFDRPSLKVRVLGITGTNGKTTTAYLLRHFLARTNHRCGMVGTVEIDDGASHREANLTTPAACDIAELLGTMRDNSCRACAIEVSSHALDQGRVAGVRFAAAGFTNLTGDHLDYHKSMENYAAAKARLFESLDSSAVAVVNDDDPASERMIERCNAKIIRFGFGKTADYSARDIATTSSGTHFILHTPDGQAEVKTLLIGRHNIQNILTAAALAGETFGLSVHQLATAARDAFGAPGRLQAVPTGKPFAVFVDYAHTDDGLENVLKALRPVNVRGRLRVLFGCGGDRDRTKRPRMARTAETLADDLYITSDNPRTEDPNGIIEEIVAGLTTDARAAAVVEPDRRAAIEKILSDARPQDVVLIAGKGHENYQIVGKVKHHFDDVEEVSRVMQSA